MPRDSRILFFSDTHKYLIDNIVFAPRSVTEMVHQYEEDFIADIAILKMRSGINWEMKQKEYTHPNGAIMTDDEIKNVWDWRRRVSSYRGVLLHWHIEMLLNGAIIHGPFSTEFSYFIDFYTQFMIGRNIIPVRTEFSIFHTGASIAGQIDLLAKYVDTDVYIIFDWKRTKALKESNTFQSLKPPLDHLDACNLNTFSLQLTIYRWILVSEYNLKVEELYFVICHEVNKAARIMKVPLWEREMELIMQNEKKIHNIRDANSDINAPFNIAHLTNLPVDKVTLA